MSAPERPAPKCGPLQPENHPGQAWRVRDLAGEAARYAGRGTGRSTRTSKHSAEGRSSPPGRRNSVSAQRVRWASGWHVRNLAERAAGIADEKAGQQDVDKDSKQHQGFRRRRAGGTPFRPNVADGQPARSAAEKAGRQERRVGSG